MINRVVVLIMLSFVVPILLSSGINHNPVAAAKTRESFFNGVRLLKQDLLAMKEMTGSVSDQNLQQQFRKARCSYKRIEAIIEYFYPYFAARLNGPPIPFFEEAEPDKMEQRPEGFQLVEAEIFPTLQAKDISLVKSQLDEMLRYIGELMAIQESFEFDDNTIIDALMEELYRITALGLSGFDSQVAFNSLTETRYALNGVQEITRLFDSSFEAAQAGQFKHFDSTFSSAQQYLQTYTSFNEFDRMQFILTYLNPLTSRLAEYKKAMQLKDNNSAMFYSAVKKNGTLFNPDAFNPYKFLDDNSSSKAKIELGKRLFFETKLSSDNTRSCASCHQPSRAFTDGLKTAAALDGHSPLRRNTPTILNAALQRNLFLDSRSSNLEAQVMEVLNNAKEMSGSAMNSARSVIREEAYSKLYKEAYPTATDANAADNICNAIASYERTLVSFNSPFDLHMNGTPALSAAAVKGFNLFMGKAKCATCHFVPVFNGSKPPRFYYVESEVIGVPSTASTKHPSIDPDSGRYLVTGVPIHLFSFKTPTLRNIARTAPYMHNGVYKTLSEVIDFYNKGGGKGLRIAPPNQSLPFDKLGLTRNEKKDLIEFLKALNDTMPLTGS